MRKWFFVLLLLVCISLVGAQTKEWPMFRGNYQSTGYADVSVNPATLQLLWEANIGFGYSHAVVKDGIVYAGNQPGTQSLFAVDAETGAVIWSFKLPNRGSDWRDVKSAVAIHEDTIIVNSWDKTVFGLNKADGILKWTFESPYPLHQAARRGFFINPSPKVLNGVVYICLGDARFHAIDASTGAGLWSFLTNSAMVCTPAIVGDIAYFASGRRGYDRTLYAVNINTHALVWSVPIYSDGTCSPVFKDGVILYGTGQYVLALDAMTGGEIWRTVLPYPNSCESPPAVTDTHIFISGGNWKVNPPTASIFCLDRSTGNVVWEKPGIFVRQAPVYAGGILFTGEYNNVWGATSYFYALNAGTGDTIWKYPTNYVITGMPAVAERRVYVMCGDGPLRAFSFELSILNVDIDIKPGSDTNSINLGSQGNVPVAIFSTEDFDATTVNPLTVTLAGANARIKGKGTAQASAADVDGDGLLDLIVHIDTTALELTEGDTIAELMGMTFDGQEIRGVDTVRIVQY